jgi:hypothetical protein
LQSQQWFGALTLTKEKVRFIMPIELIIVVITFHWLVLGMHPQQLEMSDAVSNVHVNSGIQGEKYEKPAI